jgi:uncharacterized protein YcbK (DUF882 family)
MSRRGATVLLIAPGRSTVRIGVSRLWPCQLLGAFAALVLIGAAARHGVEHLRAAARPRLVRASELVASLDRARLGTTLRAISSDRVARAVSPRVALRERSARAVVSAAPIVRAFRARAGLDLDSGSSEQAGTVLRLHALRLGESVRVQPFDAEGAPQAEAFAELSRLMRCRVTGEERAVDPRLVRILTRLAALYRRPIQLISGHRAAHVNGTSPTSQHTTGRAADIRIAGVSIDELRRTAIEIGASGVGLYPEKGFLHVDVRPHARAHWLYTEAGGEQSYDRFAAAPPPFAIPSSPPGAPAEHSGSE